MRQVRFDTVYPFQQTPGEISGQDTNVVGLKNYRAEYRMNTGYWRMEGEFRALSDDAAKELALSFIPKRKPKDITYMVVHKLWCMDDSEEQP